MNNQVVIEKYELLKSEFQKNPLSLNVTTKLAEVNSCCLQYLQECSTIDLISKVEGKEYFAFQNSSGKISRAVNKKQYLTNSGDITVFWDSIRSRSLKELSETTITNICYSTVINFCTVIDLLKTGDQKTPGTYFEYFIGHLYATHFGIPPRTQLEVLNLDMNSKLPTDFIFDLGKDKPKFHIPVKTSTRERVVQVWAHQRVLDGVYGTGRFLGLLTCLNETKLNHNTLETIEICLPDQWRIYQLFIAQLKRIYYLDLPVRYQELNSVFPKIHIKTFGSFFHEYPSLLE